jgi:hypothetical protein
MAVGPIHHRGNIYFFIHIGEYYSDIGPDRISKTPRLEKPKRRIAVHEKIRVPPVPVVRFWPSLTQKTTVLSKSRKGMPKVRLTLETATFCEIIHCKTMTCVEATA